MNWQNLKPLEKYKNGWPGPLSDLYEARHNDICIFMQFKDKYWFDREIEYYNKLKNKSYCYKMLEVDASKLLIVFAYGGNNLNHLIHNNIDIEIDYKKQVREILNDLEKDGIKKINVYPHTFFIQDGKLKISDLYGCTTQSTLMSQELLGTIINDKKRFPFVDGYLDCEATYNYTLEYSKNYWPEKI